MFFFLLCLGGAWAPAQTAKKKKKTRPRPNRKKKTRNAQTTKKTRQQKNKHSYRGLCEDDMGIRHGAHGLEGCFRVSPRLRGSSQQKSAESARGPMQAAQIWRLQLSPIQKLMTTTHKLSEIDIPCWEGLTPIPQILPVP